MAIETATDVFEEYRPVLMGVAYRMLGRVADAEDVVQDAWLRWSGSDRCEAREPRAYLVRITVRRALDRLRQLQSRTEAYEGPWLPEPLVTDYGAATPDTDERALLADSVSLAVLVALESLSPPERAVFVLREAFGFAFADIAATLDRTESAVRQMARGARRHVEERRPSRDADPLQRRVMTQRFLAAATDGDREGLLALLAPGARLIEDSGARGGAPRRLVRTADRIAYFLLGGRTRPNSPPRARLVELNGGPGMVVEQGGVMDAALQLDVVDRRVECVYLMRDPDKLLSLAGV
ncbi:sigma-70 family RNA polymerase sigma factor [Streptomyces sp. NA04227]|uniref:sigma-70 family RNA polymerase sigma factor n=1 Tax=Streptomyces sp. NA04227 TaxID=2742136 RepID=UPI0015908ED5|nr:sigma-70 family RNA polymerase sigma factor [Streptomyces sp. NA04227]QKW05323.1 sigma-70 family RNA polymerase sigma factor [Streptomyces sp. NA04227]